MSDLVIGLDIGGANLKAARTDGQARSLPFELWKNPERLGSALKKQLRCWKPTRLAITMTGELCDCFETKREGVSTILDGVQESFPSIPVRAWSILFRFMKPEEAVANSLEVASANWHALATWLAQSFGGVDEAAFMIDVGSTTADIIPIFSQIPCPLGLTDMDRLKNKELVYTGVRRTPICALLGAEVMAEFFANAHDAYLLLGKTKEDNKDIQTADGRPATKAFAHARLARMLGGDGELIPAKETKKLAKRIFEKQRDLLVEAIHSVAATLPVEPRIIFSSGSGEFLVHEACKHSSFRDVEIRSASELMGKDASTAACAYAVASLEEEEWQNSAS
ncbi:MAG: H4MPT-linked C1 transfer pathway protein [Planctomycetes bacterium]|nr:H4MPT-linked C1 transfer pathway protein [Planctomycetota bacterium]